MAEMQGWQPAPDAQCARCHANPVGPGGIICPDCRTVIENRNAALTDQLRADVPGR